MHPQLSLIWTWIDTYTPSPSPSIGIKLNVLPVSRFNPLFQCIRSNIYLRSFQVETLRAVINLLPDMRYVFQQRVHLPEQL